MCRFGVPLGAHRRARERPRRAMGRGAPAHRCTNAGITVIAGHVAAHGTGG